ncbi:MAG TPA: response regulator [Chloroflexia bacterium]|nr:response regulator [Chloroflexia bacterium]
MFLVSGFERKLDQVNEKILIVENDISVSSVMEDILTVQGQIPHCVNTCGEALKLIEKEDFDLITLDWHLRDMSGSEFLSRLASSSSTIPVIVITGDRDIENYFGQVRRVVEKPFSIEELLEAINTAIESQP